MSDAELLNSPLLAPLLDLWAERLGGAVILHAAPTGRILMVAGSVEGVGAIQPLGAQVDDFIGRFQVFAQDGSVAAIDQLPVVRAMATGQPVLNEVWLLGVAPAIVPVIVDTYPLHVDGQVAGVIATATDPKRWASRAEALKLSISLRDQLAPG